MSKARPAGMESSCWVPSTRRATSGRPIKASSTPLARSAQYNRSRGSTRTWMSQSTAARLPLELIQQVFQYLSPFDFNAARHACREWMLASQQSIILRQMLKRGGWWAGILSELGSEAENFSLVDPWHLSRRLARECSLQPGWTGNGLCAYDPTIQANPAVPYQTAFSHTHITDMTELSSSDSGPSCDHACGLSFTVSVCGRYVLVAEGCAIYVYQLKGSNLLAITTVVCPRRVLAMSLDTSCHRYAVAALLDSRMGVVCDLDLENTVKEPIYGDSTLILPSNQYRESSISSHKTPTPSAAGAISATTDSVPRNVSFHSNDASDITSIHVRSPHQSVSLLNTPQEFPRQGVNRTWRNIVQPFAELQIESGQANSIPISPSSLSIYYSLCSPDDPPRCVSICPSRRCIAFGCAAGIELHWIDSLSGKNLMKWFPLTAPSDFLYFLPGRTGIDNPNKLRLISSKAGPGQRGGVERFTGARQRRRFGMSWGTLNFDRSGMLARGPDFDHYCAVPLSDGTHVLFTDPSSGSLCLGNDAPAGGPTKLSRKITFVPPKDVIYGRGSPPTAYAVGKDLNWGVKVVAIYGEKLVLFCVPPDVFEDVGKFNTSFRDPTQEGAEESEFGEWQYWWNFELEDRQQEVNLTHTQDSYQNRAPSNGPTRTRQFGISVPLHIRGFQIAQVPGVVDIAVQSSTDLVIWTFSANGMARTWRVGSGEHHAVLQRVVERNGAVINAADGDGDWIMRDEMPDGLMNPHHVPGAFFDKDGDVEMTNVDEDEGGSTTDGDGDAYMGGVRSQLDGADEVGLIEIELLCSAVFPIVNRGPRCSSIHLARWGVNKVTD